MAEKTNFTRTTPFTDLDRQRAARMSPGLSIPAFGQGIPYIPIAGSKRIPTEAELKAQQTRSKVIEEKSRAKNEAKGLRPKPETDEQLAREIRRLQEETKAFAYTNPYFSGPQVGLFIGDVWVSNAVTIDYTESATDSPVYGYASRHYDAVMPGNVIVQGSFTIAYTGTNYLGQILARYAKTEGQNDGVSIGEADPITRAKRFYWGLEDAPDEEAVIPLNFRQSFGIAGSVGRGFDIRVFYGAREFLEDPTINRPALPGRGGPTGPIEVIKDVHLTSRSLIAQPSGDPVGEAWSFFASHVTTLRDRSPQRNINPLRVHPQTGNINAPNAGAQGVTGLGQTIRLGLSQ